MFLAISKAIAVQQIGLLPLGQPFQAIVQFPARFLILHNALRLHGVGVGYGFDALQLFLSRQNIIQRNALVTDTILVLCHHPLLKSGKGIPNHIHHGVADGRSRVGQELHATRCIELRHGLPQAQIARLFQIVRVKVQAGLCQIHAAEKVICHLANELAAGTFLIPSSVTVAEFLMDWLPKQCSKHKWAPKTYESNLSTIQNLIIPYIGSMEMQKLKPYHMENLYTTLSKTPCGSYIEGKKQELTEKQKQRFLSGTTIHEVHRLLGTAFQYAVEWGILVKSPVPVDSPKKSTQERTIWTVEEMRAALDSMEDPILHLAVHLTLVGALREGEIVGLTPEDIEFDAADGIGTFRINKSMQRVRKEALNQVDDGCIIKVFPDKLERSTTSLILKSTKTASSCRTIFMTSALKEELKKWLNQLAADEMKDPTRYHDSGMLFRLPNGLAVEPVLIRKKFLKWQDAHPEFPRIVFHGLRHSSATYQLMISGGDVKAVQGTTGHATADMLVNTYAHIQQSSRVELGRKFEEGFYAKQESPSPQAVPAAGEPTISMTALLELLKNADPEVKAQLRLALLT